MNARHPESTRHAAILGLAVGLALGFGLLCGGQARAQGHTPDPYNIVGEYNRQYEPFMYATYPNTPGSQPNQDRLETRSGVRNANQFQNFLESPDEEGEDLSRPTAPRQAGPGVPYYRANRQFDQEFQRNYRPNKIADQSFYAGQQQRNDKYFQALRETDPKKRVQLLREYNLENLRASRSLSSGRNTTERDRMNLDGAPPLPGGAAPTAGARRSSLSVPPPPTGGPGTSFPPPPLSRSRLGSAPPPPGTLPRIAPRRPGASSTSAPLPFGSGLGTSSGRTPRTRRSASDILERSERLDRDSGTTTSTAPKPVAPPPPASTVPR
jgi:hypothetical protein